MTNKYNQIVGVHYKETFLPVAKLYLAVNLNLDLYQLDEENAFLHGDLQEDVFMHQQPRFVKTSSHHALFVKKTTRGFIILIVYVDDIFILGSDSVGIA